MIYYPRQNLRNAGSHAVIPFVIQRYANNKMKLAQNKYCSCVDLAVPPLHVTPYRKELLYIQTLKRRQRSITYINITDGDAGGAHSPPIGGSVTLPASMNVALPQHTLDDDDGDDDDQELDERHPVIEPL